MDGGEFQTGDLGVMSFQVALKATSLEHKAKTR